MTRHMKREERQRQAAARRSGALARAELREPSVPREAPQGPTSFAVKARDPDLADQVAAFLAKRNRVR